MAGVVSSVFARHASRNAVKFTAAVRTYKTPINTGILFVPERQAWVVERLGKFYQVLKPGLNFCIPLVDRIAYVQSLKEIAIDIPDQAAITADNVVLQLNGVLFLRVIDPYKASYGVEDAEFAITQLAQTTMRSEIGKIELDNVFKERETLNHNIVQSICKAAEPWGIECMRYEIRDIHLPTKIKEAMQMQVEADRKKRAAILESEGQRDAEINRAEGVKRSQVLSSEGRRTETVNHAAVSQRVWTAYLKKRVGECCTLVIDDTRPPLSTCAAHHPGEAEAILRLAESRAMAVRKLADAITSDRGVDAVQMAIAERYIDAFAKLAKSSNTMLLPSQAGDVSSMVAQALAIFQSVKRDAPAPSNPQLTAMPLPSSSKSAPPTSTGMKKLEGK